MILTQKKIISLLTKTIQEKGMHYRKNVLVEVRSAINGEVIVTKTLDGIETKNFASKNDFVIRNPLGEEYIISDEKLRTRYKKKLDKAINNKEGYSYYYSLGECFGIVADEEVFDLLGLKNKQTFNFEPLWGGSMRCNKGDMLVTTNQDIPEIYRIAVKEFKDTYIRI